MDTFTDWLFNSLNGENIDGIIVITENPEFNSDVLRGRDGIGAHRGEETSPFRRDFLFLFRNNGTTTRIFSMNNTLIDAYVNLGLTEIERITRVCEEISSFLRNNENFGQNFNANINNGRLEFTILEASSDLSRDI